MTRYVAQRIVFQNGERTSVLQVPGGLPVHEVTLYLGTYRTKGRAANTIHHACTALALLYRELHAAEIILLERLTAARFLTTPELERLVTAARYHIQDLDLDESVAKDTTNVINLRRISPRRHRKEIERKPVDSHTHASRLRYIANFLEFLSNYVGATLSRQEQRDLRTDTEFALRAFRENIPARSGRAKVGARVGLSLSEQDLVLSVVHPASEANPWARGFIRLRNWLIVVLLLATGMRRGELLGLQIGDVMPNEPKLKILRRADDPTDLRIHQPATKTNDRIVELSPAIMKVLMTYQYDRRKIKAARSIPQLIVSDEGEALSTASIDKLFRQLREACPGLTTRLSSHTMRHTWNERFSEQADAMKLPEVAEQRARNSHQGWSDNSKTSVTYTKRHTEKTGRELALKIQKNIDEKLSTNS